MTAWMQFAFDWDTVSTYWTPHILRQIPTGNREALTFDYDFGTVWAVGALTRMSRHVSDVDIVQSSFFRRHVRFLQRFNGCGRGCSKFKVRMKTQQVEWSIFSNSVFDPDRKLFYFFNRVAW